MSTMIVNRAAEEALIDLQTGLQLALTEFVRNKDYARAEEILRQVDINLAHMINTSHVA